jgi:hypothetical protein
VTRTGRIDGREVEHERHRVGGDLADPPGGHLEAGVANHGARVTAARSVDDRRFL